MKNTWYNILTSDDGKKAEIFIFEEIGMWGITAQQFINDFKAIEANDIDIHINCPGGDVMDGTAIYNIIQHSKKNITMIIDGLAASMASIIAMAGNTVQMADNAFFMIHNPSGLTWGDAEEMEKMAEILNKIKSQLITAYQNKTGIDREEIAQMMDDETWLDAKEAKKKGFVDTIIKGHKKVALFDTQKFGFKNSKKYDLKNSLDNDLLSGALSAAPAAAPVKKKPENNNTSEDIMNIKELQDKHPEIYNEVLALGKTEGITAGAKAESERIASINDLGITGHDELVNKALADGKSTAGDVATAVLKADKISNGLALADRITESTEAAAVQAGAAPDQVDQDMNEEKIKANAKKMADLANAQFAQN